MISPLTDIDGDDSHDDNDNYIVTGINLTSTDVDDQHHDHYHHADHVQL